MGLMSIFKCCSSGYVLGRKSLGKRKASEQSKDSSPWQVKAKFGNITYWNHGTLPSQDDTFRRSFHWLTVAQAVWFRSTINKLNFLDLDI